MRAALVLIVSLAFLAGCGGSDNGGETTESVATGVDECASVGAPDPRDPEPGEAPAEPLDASKTHTLTFDTSCGSFTITLDTELAPNTAASLVALANAGYFDETIFHRVVPGFVIQGGDPTQSGGGGPGYSTVDAPPSDAARTRRASSQWRSRESRRPEPRGSQFFVVTSETAAGVLTPDYSIVGEVTEGMETVERIAALGVGDGPPSQPVVVNTVSAASS